MNKKKTQAKRKPYRKTKVQGIIGNDLSVKQLQWSNKVISDIVSGKPLDMNDITKEVYNVNDNTKRVVTHKNKHNSKIQEYISNRLEELRVYSDIGKKDVENRLTELIFSSRTKPAEVSSLAKTLGDYKGFNNLTQAQQVQVNLYSLDEQKVDIKENNQ